MRFLTADYLYPLHTKPLKQGVLQISDKGEVVAIFEDRKHVPKEKLEVFEGILCPGFVNAHCHLELSHLKGIAKKGIGLLDFIGTVQTRNTFDKKDILAAIECAEEKMIANGIVGVGDICNTSDTLFQKQKGNLQYYNFIEVFGVQDEKMNQIIFEAKDLRNQFRAIGLQSTISPHSPYSVPPKLMREIAGIFDEKDKSLTIHIQESLEEKELFENKKGAFFTWLKSINASSGIWESRNKSTDILKELENKRVLLIHNTFAKKEDISSNYYCTCPKANLYIENILPDYSIFDANRLCVGTDSLASNNSLSILEELQIIKENTNFDFNTLLKIASKNGAEALGFVSLGTFEKGKNPGVNLISELIKIKIII
jgi:cytosine/adenosine deaminase-related metal-dependent hydrolase